MNISGGVNALVRHAETEAHKGSILQMRNQSTFKASTSGYVALLIPSKPEIVLTMEENTLKAEITGVWISSKTTSLSGLPMVTTISTENCSLIAREPNHMLKSLRRLSTGFKTIYWHIN